jgi:hypothetical protein
MPTPSRPAQRPLRLQRSSRRIRRQGRAQTRSAPSRVFASWCRTYAVSSRCEIAGAVEIWNQPGLLPLPPDCADADSIDTPGCGLDLSPVASEARVYQPAVDLAHPGVRVLTMPVGFGGRDLLVTIARPV